MEYSDIILTVFSIVLTILSLVIAYQARQNGRFMKGEMKSTKELIAEGNKSTRELIAKMDERSAKMDEKAEQRHQEVIKLLERGFGDLSSGSRQQQ